MGKFCVLIFLERETPLSNDVAEDPSRVVRRLPILKTAPRSEQVEVQRCALPISASTLKGEKRTLGYSSNRGAASRRCEEQSSVAMKTRWLVLFTESDLAYIYIDCEPRYQPSRLSTGGKEMSNTCIRNTIRGNTFGDLGKHI